MGESQSPISRANAASELVESLDQSRLSDVGRAKLDEAFRAKFPNAHREPPQVMRVQFVGPPVPDDALQRMSDEQWLTALKRYAGVGRRRDREFGRSGGERQLAQALERYAKADPVRFVMLAMRMSDDLPASYFDAILRGVADCLSQDTSVAPRIDLRRVVD